LHPSGKEPINSLTNSNTIMLDGVENNNLNLLTSKKVIAINGAEKTMYIWY